MMPRAGGDPAKKLGQQLPVIGGGSCDIRLGGSLSSTAEQKSWALEGYLPPTLILINYALGSSL